MMVSIALKYKTLSGVITALLLICIIGGISLYTSFPSLSGAGVEPALAESTGYFVPSSMPRSFWTQGGNIWLTPSGTQLKINDTILHTYFVDANPDVAVYGEAKLDSQVNVLIGNNPDQWMQGESAYAQVIYQELYAGINLNYRFLNGILKSEYEIQPETSLEAIQIAYDDGVQLSIKKAGRVLQVVTPDGLTVEEEIPEAYQVIEGQRQPVGVVFELVSPSTYTFAIKGSYDPSLPLIIDPVLLYSTYLGGSAPDAGWVIARGTNGDTYVAGITQSLDMPTAPATPVNAGNNVFVARLNAQKELVFITILGGETGEEANGIGVDAAGNVYVAGETFSTDFPLKNAWQPYFAGYEDAYVAKLDPSGNLVYSTYIGGNRGEEVDDVYVDAAGNAYLGGEVYSDDYPLLNPWSDKTYGWDEEDGFLSIFNTDGQLIYSTLFSAPQRDQVFQFTVDAQGYVYATGMTSSPGFPISNAFQSTYGGGWDDCLVFKFDPWNNEMLYASFLGGNGYDECWGIAVDDTGAAYVAGHTNSPNYPVVNAYQPTYGGEYDAFIAKISPDGSQLLFSTFMGGAKRDMARSLDLDGAGNVYIAGMTDSAAFLTKDALQSTYGGKEDAFVLVMSSEGTPLYSSFLGGSEYDRAFSIEVDQDGIAHIVGKTESTDFPVLSPLQGYQGNGDAFISSFRLVATPIPTATPSPTPTPFASAQMDGTGGTLSLSWADHVTVLNVPQDVFNVTTQVTLTYEIRAPYQGDLMGNDHFFSVQAQPINGGEPLSSFSSPVQLELTFPPISRIGLWGLYELDGQTWSTNTLTVTGYSPHSIEAKISQTGTYGVLGPNNPLFLPFIMR